MKIQTYESQVGKPVKPVVKDPGLTIAGGVGALGQGLAQGALAVGDVVQAVQRRSDYDYVANGISQDVDEFFTAQRKDPILPGVNDRNPDGSFKDVIQMREEAWNEKKKELEDKYFKTVTHKRALDDLNSWWTQASQKIQNDVANEAITESLQYYGKRNEIDINDAILRGDLESANSLNAFGVDNGFRSRAQAEVIYNFARNEVSFINARDFLMDGGTSEDGTETLGYGDYGDHFLGWEASFNSIDEMKTDDVTKNRLREHVNQVFKNDMFVETEFKKRNMETAWNEYTNQIEHGEVTDIEAFKRSVGEDDRLTASAKEHIWDRLDSSFKSGPKGSEFEQNYIPEAFDLFKDPNLTDEEYIQGLRRLDAQGYFPSPSHMYFWMNRNRPDEFKRGAISDGADMIDKVINSLLSKADSEDAGGIASRGLYAKDMYERLLQAAGDNFTEKDQQDALGQVINYVLGESIVSDPFASRASGGLVDRVTQSSFESVIQAVRSGEMDYIVGFEGNAEALIFAEHEGLRILQDQYSDSLKNIETEESGTVDFRYKAKNELGFDVYYRFNTTPNGKRSFLEKYNPSTGKWDESALRTNDQLAARIRRSETENKNPWETSETTAPTTEPSTAPPMVGEIPEMIINLPMSELRSQLRSLDIHMSREQILDAKLEHVFEMFQAIENPRRKTHARIQRRLEQYGYPVDLASSAASTILRRLGAR